VSGALEEAAEAAGGEAVSFPVGIANIVSLLDLKEKRETGGNEARGEVTLAPLVFTVVSWHREDCEYKSTDGRRTDNAYTIRVVVLVIGRDSPDRSGVRLTFTRMFWADVPEQKALRELLREAMSHEIDECILVDGKRVYDPHADERNQ
jgi:hypothetical protein